MAGLICAGLASGCASAAIDPEPGDAGTQGGDCRVEPELCASFEKCDPVSGKCERPRSPIPPDFNADPGPDGGPGSQSCRGVSCPERAPSCEAGDRLIRSAGGACREGECVYEEEVIECAALGRRCEAGACVPISCDGSCDDLAPSCDGNDRVTQTEGVCQDSACSYTESRTSCSESNQICRGGACVEASCEPACPPGSTCGLDGCEFATCQAMGDACDGSVEEQGAFRCLLFEGEAYARCYATCAVPSAASSCPSGSRCSALEGRDELNVCIESQCSSSAICSGGTCLAYDNGFGRCVAAGTLAEGEACSGAGECAVDSLCVSDGAGGARVCRALCDPWAATSECSAGSACRILNSRTGYCTPNATASAPQDAFAVCSPAGSWCADATLCAPNGRCLRFCNADHGDRDCAVPSGLVCDNYYYDGDRSYGLCLPDCRPDPSSCGAGAACDAKGRCRKRCTEATLAADCCDGRADGCRARCVADLCE